MFRTFRNMPVATTVKFTGAAFIAVLISTGTAAAEESLRYNLRQRKPDSL
jgi:hypothetical protein